MQDKTILTVHRFLLAYLSLITLYVFDCATLWLIHVWVYWISTFSKASQRIVQRHRLKLRWVPGKWKCDNSSHYKINKSMKHTFNNSPGLHRFTNLDIIKFVKVSSSSPKYSTTYSVKWKEMSSIKFIINMKCK